ncbi:hypothetical protein [Paenibacillus sp. SC116]|uniref:hypothetical protein n=1 Tax=Paenibacillus sp. SC116 TaxID=2968986 RepID=UPI00215AF273|nr:hypothetical protein [Paenibacillus sp. SC116]
MGLDIVLFDEKKVRVGIIELPNSLHEAIFKGTSNWSSYMQLRKMKDYYKTNVRLNQSELFCFVEDLKQVRLFINSTYHTNLDSLVQSLSSANVKAIHVGGD